MEIAAVTFVVIMAFGAVGLVLGLVAAITWYLSRLYFATEESSSDEDIELGVVNDFLRGGNVYRSERSDHTHEAYNAASADDGNPPPPYDPSWAPTLQLAPRRASSPLLPLWSTPSPLSVPPRPASA
ncbi:hypothetical protein F5Y02DRAFT_412679 [Annulohypoxylon stygium]|nr:hypothetical protein F5Y02DRAFT_412679 [Annulohypoxylon stygium]